MRNSVGRENQMHPAQKIGAITNILKILSDDNKRVRPQALMSVADINKSRGSKALDVSRPSMYEEEITVKPDVLKKIITLVMVTDTAYLLLGENVEETKKWVISPNTLLFGDTPFEVCMRSEGQALLSWLNQKLGLTSGPAF